MEELIHPLKSNGHQISTSNSMAEIPANLR